MSVIAFSRSIGPVPLACMVSERHSSGLDITEVPIETGSKITDHAVVLPKSVMLEVGGENAAATLDALIRFQESRAPFVLVTGLKIYKDMLIKRIDADRTPEFSQILRARVELQEIILVGTAHTADPNGDGDADSSTARGKAGGDKSTRSAAPSADKAGDATTADRASGTVQTGDNPTKTLPDQSILKGWLQ